MKFLYAILFLFVTYNASCQKTIPAIKYFIINGGSVSFGTGDYLGYFLGTQFLNKRTRHFGYGFELGMENGKKQPEITDVSLTFNQVSNVSLTTSIHYFPFNKILPGFNIAIGPCLGYQTKTKEYEQITIFNSSGVPIERRSYLGYNNVLFAGYSVSVNFNFRLENRWMIGIRSDLKNYTNGDINTLLGIKGGYSFN